MNLLYLLMERRHIQNLRVGLALPLVFLMFACFSCVFADHGFNVNFIETPNIDQSQAKLLAILTTTSSPITVWTDSVSAETRLLLAGNLNADTSASNHELRVNDLSWNGELLSGDFTITPDGTVSSSLLIGDRERTTTHLPRRAENKRLIVCQLASEHIHQQILYYGNDDTLAVQFLPNGLSNGMICKELINQTEFLLKEAHLPWVHVHTVEHSRGLVEVCKGDAGFFCVRYVKNTGVIVVDFVSLDGVVHSSSYKIEFPVTHIVLKSCKEEGGVGLIMQYSGVANTKFSHVHFSIDGRLSNRWEVAASPGLTNTAVLMREAIVRCTGIVTEVFILLQCSDGTYQLVEADSSGKYKVLSDDIFDSNEVWGTFLMSMLPDDFIAIHSVKKSKVVLSKNSDQEKVSDTD